MTTTASLTRIYDQLDIFLRYVALTAVGMAALEMLAAWMLRSLALGVVAGCVFGFALGLTACRQVLRRGRTELAGGLTVLVFLATPICFVAALPFLLPIGVFFLIAACSLPMVFRSQQLFRLAAAATVVTAVLLAAVSLMPPLFPQPAPLIDAIFRLTNLPICSALMALLFYFVWQNFSASLDNSERANGELRSLQASLEQQVADRMAELASALADVQARSDAQAALLAENQQQRDTIKSLSVPVLPIGGGNLVMPLIGLLDAERLDTLLSRALAAIAARPTRRLVLDVTGVPVIDEQVAAGLMRVPQAARLLGAEVVLVGMNPEFAQTVVSLGLSFAGLRTASTLQDVLESR